MAGRRRRKACMGWSWVGACGVQGRGHIVRPRAQLVLSRITQKLHNRFSKNRRWKCGILATENLDFCGNHVTLGLRLGKVLVTIKRQTSHTSFCVFLRE